jgi:FkbM family methyltransferase
MADVLCSIEEARENGTLQVFEKKTKYHDYQFLVRSEEEIKFNVSQNISTKPTGGEYFKPLFIPHYAQNGSPMVLEDLDHEDVWLDAGGHIGIFATRLLTQFPKIKKVYSYEPFHNNVEFAEQNIQMNGVQDRCEIIEKAIVADDLTEVEFFLSQDSGKHSVHPIRGRQVTRVPAENINTIIKEKGITCIKMDIEGLEYDMIRALNQESLDQIRLFIVEYHFHYSWLLENRSAKFNEVLDIFRANFDQLYVNPRTATGKHFITHFAGFKSTK